VIEHELHSIQAARWPQNGEHVLASPDLDIDHDALTS